MKNGCKEYSPKPIKNLHKTTQTNDIPKQIYLQNISHYCIKFSPTAVFCKHGDGI